MLMNNTAKLTANSVEFLICSNTVSVMNLDRGEDFNLMFNGQQLLFRQPLTAAGKNYGHNFPFYEERATCSQEGKERHGK
jgi:hypothetical protein